MKKFLLFAAAFAALSMSAQDVTVTPMWEITNVPTAADARQGFGMGGKFYINIKGEDPRVVVYGEGGLTDEEWPGGTNCGISHDQVGNIIVSTAVFPNAWECNGETELIKVINPSTGLTKEYAIPDDLVTGRCDFIGNAQGNMMEDGVLYLAGGTNQGVVILTIANGAVDEDNTYEATLDPVVNPSGGQTSNVINVFKDANGDDAILYVYRGTIPYLLTFDGENFTGAAITSVLPGRSNSNGADVFALGGKEYVCYPSAPAIGNYFDGFSICEVGGEEPIFVKEPTITSGTINAFQGDWVNAEVIDENTVYVYQYAPGKSMGVWKVSIGGAEEHTYAVTGKPAALFAMENDWDPVAAPEMQLNDNGLYEWISAETELEAGTIELKIVEDHAWDVCYPASDESGYNNYTVTVEEAGKYVLTVYFNPETKEVTHELVKTEVPPVEPAKVFILGEVNGNTWAPNVGVEMETEDNKVFTKEVTLVRPENRDGQKYCFFSFATKLMEAADDWDGLAPYRFGAVSNGDFLFEPDMMGQPLALTAENGQAFQVPEGEYTLTVDLENMTLTIEGTIYSGIEYINTVNVKNVRFYNLQGMESATPFQGVNIVVSEMTDGSKVITKVVK